MQLLKIENSMLEIFKIDQTLVFENLKYKSVKKKVAFSPKFNDFPKYNSRKSVRWSAVPVAPM